MSEISEKSDLSILAKIIVEICSDPTLQSYKPQMVAKERSRRFGNRTGLNSQSKESKFGSMQGTVIHERYSVAKGINLDHVLKAAVVMYSKSGEVASEKAKLSLQRNECNKLSLAINKLQKTSPDDTELIAMKERLAIVSKQMEETILKTKEKGTESKATHARRALKILCAGAKAAESLHQKIMMVMMGKDPDNPIEEDNGHGRPDMGSDIPDLSGGNWRSDRNGGHRQGPTEPTDSTEPPRRGGYGGYGGSGGGRGGFGGYGDRNQRNDRDDGYDRGFSGPRRGSFGNNGYGERTDRSYRGHTNNQQQQTESTGKKQYIPPHLRDKKYLESGQNLHGRNIFDNLDPELMVKDVTGLPPVVKPIAIKGAWGEYKNTLIGSKQPPLEIKEVKPKEVLVDKSKFEKLNFDPDYENQTGDSIQNNDGEDNGDDDDIAHLQILPEPVLNDPDDPLHPTNPEEDLESPTNNDQDSDED